MAAAAVEDAVKAEALPAICSSTGCEEPPIVRWSPSADEVLLVCMRHLVPAVATQTVAECQQAVGALGVVVSTEAAEAIAAVASFKFLQTSEVLP